VLEAPQALTVITAAAGWSEATITELVVAKDLANVTLTTPGGAISRTLTLQDGGDGVLHYLAQDRGARSTLSVNPQTREYFYEESGVLNGQPYTVNAHGWLQVEIDLAM
jgi:hypothetical protein